MLNLSGALKTEMSWLLSLPLLLVVSWHEPEPLRPLYVCSFKDGA